MISAVRSALGTLGLAGADSLRAETGLPAASVEEALAYLCRTGRAELWQPEQAATAGPRAVCKHCPLAETCAPRGNTCPPDAQMRLYRLTPSSPDQRS